MKINEDAIGSRKLFWNGVKNVRNQARKDCGSITGMGDLADQGEVKNWMDGNLASRAATVLELLY